MSGAHPPQYRPTLLPLFMEKATDLQMGLLGDRLLVHGLRFGWFQPNPNKVLQERQVVSVPRLQTFPGAICALCSGLMVSVGLRFLERTS